MTRLLVVGADAAGMSAAHQALRTASRRGRELDVVVLERSGLTSYSACGIPYWIAGDLDSPDELVARTAARHRELGVDLRMGVTAQELDLARREVTATVDGVAGRQRIGFDLLVLVTGGQPVVPDWARAADGGLIAGVRPVKTLDDGTAWLEALLPRPTAPRRGVVVGGGYIGVEMAEALLRRGLEVTLVTRSEVMSSLDPDMSGRVRDEITSAGVKVLAGAAVEGVLTDAQGAATAVVTRDQEIAADVVVIGLGVAPATALGLSGGLPVGRHGGYLPDPTQRVADGVWAAGDCCEVLDRVLHRRAYLPLGTHANKQGRVAGTNLAGGEARFGGALGTAITRFVGGGVHVEVSRVGPCTRSAEAAGRRVASLVTEGRTASGYMPEANPIATKVLADAGTRELLGMQIVGGDGAAKRIDTAAAAIWGHATVDDLAAMDLAYAPPFATVWEAVQLAARRLADHM